MPCWRKLIATLFAFVSLGCGKTTIVKLLLGILTPSSGKVLINGKDVSNINIDIRKKIVAIISQDYTKYGISMRENIAFDNITKESDKDIIKMLNLVSDSNKLMKNMTNGLDTILGKNINDGIDLSGGQWQTIAIVRALYRNTPLLILDEPTASLDPIAEVEVYTQLAKASESKTIVYVTHRLGSSKFANTILTIQEGKIIERGNHKELMKLGGTYARMYNAQKQWYKQL